MSARFAAEEGAAAPDARTATGHGLGARLISSVGALTSTFALWSVLQILAVPVFVGHWGTALYGEWLALNAAVGFLSLLDAGISVHLVNRIMAAAVRGDHDGVHRFLATGLALFTVLIAAGALLLGVAWLADAPTRMGLSAPDAGLAGLLLSVATLVLLPRMLVGGLFAARGQFTRSVYIASALQLLPVGAQLVVVAAGGGLSATAAAHLVATVLAGWVLPLAILRRCHPDIRFGLGWPTPEELRDCLRKSLLHNLSSASTPVMLHLPVLVLQALNPGGDAVVAFTTMRTFSGLLRQLVNQVGLSAGVEMTRQHHQNDRAGLSRLFAAVGRITGGGAGLLGGLMVVLGPPFFALWTHGTVAFDTGLGLVFMGTTLLMVPGLAAATVLRQTDHAELLAVASAAQITVAAGLCLALTATLGGLGAALAVAAAETLTVGWLALRRAVRVFALDGARTLTASWGAALAGFGVGGGVAVALHGMLVPSGFVGLAAFSIVWALIVAPPAFLILPPPETRAWLFGVVFRLSARVRGRR